MIGGKPDGYLNSVVDLSKRSFETNPDSGKNEI